MAAERTGPSDVSFDVPLFEDLWNLDSEIQQRFPRKYGKGLDHTGVYFSMPQQLKMGESYCTPTNSIAFAYTGGDGEHFSFLVQNSAVDSESPIILTAPANSGEENVILAENFDGFLRLGLRRGYFGLGQFAYDPNSALEAYGNPQWQPTEPAHGYVGYVPDEEQIAVLTFIADQLNLQPIFVTPEEFESLQDRIQPLLEMPLSYDDW